VWANTHVLRDVMQNSIGIVGKKRLIQLSILCVPTPRSTDIHLHAICTKQCVSNTYVTCGSDQKKIYLLLGQSAAVDSKLLQTNRHIKDSHSVYYTSYQSHGAKLSVTSNAATNSHEHITRTEVIAVMSISILSCCDRNVYLHCLLYFTFTKPIHPREATTEVLTAVEH